MNIMLITTTIMFGLSLASALFKKEMTKLLVSILSMYLAIVLAVVSNNPSGDGVLFVLFFSSVVVLWIIVGACIIYRRHRATGLNTYDEGNGLKN